MKDTFIFERPSMARKDEILEYLTEFAEDGSEIHGSGSLDRALQGETFEQALDRCLGMENKEYAAAAGRCPGKTFLLIRRRDDRIVGTINVRWDLNEEMRRFGGHIGYGIRPSERRQGYNKINLYAGLKEAQKLGLEQVMLSCTVSNEGSNRSILALGGVLERSETDPEDGLMTNVYRIGVDRSLERYKQYDLCMKQVFRSDRISFVEVSELLIDDYLRMVNDYEHVNRFIGGKKKEFTREQELAWVQEKLEEKALVFSMLDKKNGAYIGNIELMDVTDTGAELGIAITACRQEKGYGTEAIRALTGYAMEQLGLERVYLRTNPANARAIHVYEKCGFREYDRSGSHVFMEIKR